MKEIEDNFLKKPQHGAFFDGCMHHCTSCNRQPNADVWNGNFIVSSNNSGNINMAVAFSLWYDDNSLDNFSYKVIKRPSGSGGSKHVYMQPGAYPCTSCCNCAM